MRLTAIFEVATAVRAARPEARDRAGGLCPLEEISTAFFHPGI
jgi:hypothetical protein